MIERSINHKPLIIPFVIILVVTAGVLTYKKYNVSDPVVPTIEVKAGEVSVSKNNYYSDTLGDEHLKLTPSNIVWFTNYYRTQNNVAPLRMRDALNRSAHQKNVDMILNQYFDHVRTTNKGDQGFEIFIDAQNYGFIKVGENLARGDFTTSRDVVAAWMKSDAHRHNLLDRSYTDIGVSIDRGYINGVQTTFFTQHFGLPEKKCPMVDSDLKLSIQTIRSRIDTLAGDITKEDSTMKLMDPDKPEYDTHLENYNSMVGIYNGLVNQLQDLVDNYNQQVSAFDQCVKQVE